MAIRTINVGRSVLADNDEDAARLREELRRQGTYLVNVMSSPGAGKTTLLRSLIALLSGKWRVGVLEADIDSDVDARKIAEDGTARTVQLHTGGMCHLEARMTREGLGAIDAKDLDLVFLENVGNLVCPAEYDTGACLNMVILSVPEGDDKPLKYPLMFELCDLVVLSKMDTRPFFTFDLEKCERSIRMRSPRCEIIPVSAKTGENMEAVAGYLDGKTRAWKETQQDA